MTRKLLFRGAGCLIAAGLWLGLSQQQPEELTVTKIADDLHVIVGSGGNVAVYATQEGVILVDDKFDRNVPQILEKMKSVTDKPLRYVLNTHHHGDHSGGNAGLIAQGARVIAHENALANIERNKMPGSPELTYSEKMSVHLGGKQVRMLHFGRGHTNGDTIMYFPALKTIHTGDLFVAGRPFVDYANGGSATEWTSTLEQALRLDFETVIPGHGPIMKKSDLAGWRQSMLTMQSRVRELKKQGKSKEEAGKLLRFDDLGLWSAPSRLWERSYDGIWDELGR